MLTELHIENLGVIERASLVFTTGMTALTGETGAGKTMLVEAIELLVGGRADASVVRTGAAEARVDGRLFVPRHDGSDGVDEVVLSRVVPVDGRSRAYVNGRPATVANLAEVASGVIDLHGQHAHQGLLSTATQRAALDRFGAVELNQLRAARARVAEVDAELATLGGDERARAREIDLLRFQVAELDAAHVVSADEDALLATEESTLADAVAHREAGEGAVEALRTDGGASDRIAAALGCLGDREPYVDLVQRLAGVAAELDDISAELRDLSERIDEDPERLAEIRERRQSLVDLRRKYGADLGEVMVFHAAAEVRLRELEQYDRRAAELDGQREAAYRAAEHEAGIVGERRRAVAPLLAEAVQVRLRELAMPHASIDISVGREHAHDPGDDVTFLLAANPGSPPLPLSKVASGGELARAMLALRLVLSGEGGRGASALVFDEVDAGIGGAAAVAVGRALADLSVHHQVLVVTHLPQVAAHASQQLVVAKHVTGDATFTDVTPVAGDDRVAEVARMLA
ncbi:MAG TPA: DNA repair protein RecN, partial [Ilumatobacter sp.]|nr:DNA repair protein RecN [Ilumatobacter sp.]